MLADGARVELAPLGGSERRDLLHLARASICAAFDPAVSLPVVTLTRLLVEPTAAFVSLHSKGRLRGCVGTVMADKPLHETVAHMARAAAFDDPRFPPVEVLEVPLIDIEISRLSRMVPVEPSMVQPGVHGVCISYDGQRAVFLPQVATAHGWDRETLLDELCRKALLPPAAWRHRGCALLVFIAEVFGEVREAQMVND
jgi:AmmeMemoRadiSam system protein A